MSTDNWLEMLMKIQKEIDGLNPTDRLSHVSGIVMCISAINNSMIGWSKWLISPSVMNKFSEQELKKIFEYFKALSINILEEDMYWTRKKQKKKRKKKNNKTKLYRV